MKRENMINNYNGEKFGVYAWKMENGVITENYIAFHDTETEAMKEAENLSENGFMVNVIADGKIVNHAEKTEKEGYTEIEKTLAEYAEKSAEKSKLEKELKVLKNRIIDHMDGDTLTTNHFTAIIKRTVKTLLDTQKIKDIFGELIYAECSKKTESVSLIIAENIAEKTA